VVCCCIGFPLHVTNYPKHSSSKPHPFISLRFCRSRVLWWVFCSGFHKDNFQVSAGALLLSGGPGEESTPKLCGQNSVTCSCKMGASVDFLSVTCWSLPACRGHPHSLPCGPLHPQDHQQKLSCVLNLLHAWDFSLSDSESRPMLKRLTWLR